MGLRRHARACLLGFALGFASLAQAQFCAGFVDVSLNDHALCNNVSWMKNRAVTLGCDATHYCPADPVGRLAMAAFMNRVGNVMTPTVFSVEDTGASLDPLLDNIVCKTAMLPAANYQRTHTADAALSFDVTGPLDVSVEVVRSINGTTWLGEGGANYPFVDTGARHHVHTITTPVTLTASPTLMYQFGLQVTGASSLAHLNSIGNWTCHLQVVVVNRVE